MGRSEHTLSKQDTCCTPPEIWQPIVNALGPIMLDPCSHPVSSVPAATRVLLPELYWTDPEKAPPQFQDCGDHDVMWANGLQISWKGCGLVWFQPPYSELPDKNWIVKARDDTDEVAGLLPVRTATQWWQKQLVYYDAITFLEQRVSHENTFNKKGEPTDDPAPFGQALVYCGPRVALWVAEIGKLGWTVLGVPR
jgi:hypothetical protein